MQLACAAALSAQEWTRFRGPNGSGIGQAPSLPATWTERDFAWRVPLAGLGHSSPVVWGDKVFVTSGKEETGERLVMALDADSGRLLWTRLFAAAAHGKHQLNSFASATPAADAEGVYACWATPEEYIVVALDHQGNELWRADLGPYGAGHGFGASPIVYNDLVIVPCDRSQDSFLAALDRRDGQVRWKSPRDDEVTWYTPCVYQPPGRAAELIVTNWKTGLAAIDAESGRVAWSLDVFEKGHVEASISSPIVAGELVLGVCGWLGVRQEVVAVRPADAARGPQRAYTIDRAVPLCTTPLAYDDLLFMCSDAGIASCADLATGQSLWRKRLGGTFYGSPVCVNGRLYCPSAEGEMVVLAAARTFELLGRSPLGEETHSTPAVARGRMFVRTFTHLLALGDGVGTTGSR